MCKRIAIVYLVGLAPAFAAHGQGEAPPAIVSVASVETGRLAPTDELTGTVYYKEVSSLATEVSGKVLDVLFEEGHHVKKGDPMVRLDFELLESQLAAAQAVLRQNRTQLAQEQVRLERAELLLKDEATTPQEYDDIRFTVESLGHRVEASQAEVERLDREISKKVTAAPFDGIVIERNTEVGEWKSNGATVAVLARDRLFDVIVNVPETCLPWIEIDAMVDMRVNDRSFQGRVVSVIPRGDVATRTFPVKIRVDDQDWLMEGMSARVNIPIGERRECLLVPRDAVLLEGGQNVVVLARDGKAARLPVTILGYQGLSAGIQVDGLQEGMQVIVKGHERVREGQSLEVIP